MKRRHLVPALPWLVAIVAFASALFVTLDLGLRGRSLLTVYTEVSFYTGLIAFFLWLLIPWLRPSYRGGPFRAGARMVREKWRAILLVFVAFPIFMSAFTILKIAFPLYTGYRWDGFWTHLEIGLFGTDPWRYTHAVIGQKLSHWLTSAYAYTWALSMAFAVPILAFNASVERSARAMAALMASWIVAGVLFAAAFSSVGPVFAYLVDPELGRHFAPLKQSLAQHLERGNTVLITQKYLAMTYLKPALFKGGGISAMPSMHVAAALWMSFVAPRGPVRWLAVAQWAVIWVASVHFGYHYALDGLLGSLVAAGCWALFVGRPYARGATQKGSGATAGPPLSSSPRESA